MLGALFREQGWGTGLNRKRVSKAQLAKLFRVFACLAWIMKDDYFLEYELPRVVLFLFLLPSFLSEEYFATV